MGKEDTFDGRPRPPFIFEQELSMVMFYALWGVHLTHWLPCIITFGVPFPFDKILQGPRSSMMSVVDYLFHHIFLLPFDKVRWQPGVVRPVLIGFMIR